MSLDNTSIPSVIRLPNSADDIATLVRNQILEHEPSVIILDLDQGSVIVQKSRSLDIKLDANSLPFLLSNHTLNMAGVSESIGDCLLKLFDTSSPEILAVFINPSHSDEIGGDYENTFLSSIVTENSVVAYIESEGERTLNLISIGE